MSNEKRCRYALVLTEVPPSYVIPKHGNNQENVKKLEQNWIELDQLNNQVYPEWSILWGSITWGDKPQPFNILGWFEDTPFCELCCFCKSDSAVVMTTLKHEPRCTSRMLSSDYKNICQSCLDYCVVENYLHGVNREVSGHLPKVLLGIIMTYVIE
jgi:hypothetical protein